MDPPNPRTGFALAAFKNRKCLVTIVLFWSFLAAYTFLFHGALYTRVTWSKISGTLEHSVVGLQIQNDTAPNMISATEEDDIQIHGWDYDGKSADTEERDVADEEIELLPLEPLHEEFLAGRATVFLLRIQKAASSTLDVMFSTDVSMTECEPNMRALEGLEGETCNRLFNLLHYAEYDPENCQGMAAWDDPAWQNMDCISWIFSYSYVAKYHSFTAPIRARIQRTFQRARLVSGHFSYGLHSIGHRGTFAYVTTLRHPVSRVVSWWNWNIQTGKLSPVVPPAGNATFDEFVWDDDFRFGGFQTSNHMTRVLCNRETGVQLEDGASAEERLVEGDTPRALLAEVTREHYECALRNLRSFALVFVAENMSDVKPLAPVVSRLFNMKEIVGPLEDTVINPTTLDDASTGLVVRSHNLSEATAARLADLNRWDALLYEEEGKLHKISVARLKKWGSSEQA
ncbi:hypothetical protein KFL_000550360 [Klebsormidium nitens]|uniref:Uncharacterized protein n=1 Tax=Klebsormidium nitens TaxID=105231 RepID=A0A1Y1HVE3_KLENI|nr:hypothetical protein KFL_000550360 [Klebsormidium nitens]|eukprot:GAQ80507.1 hypothetical protein KFL_000550360 [Klebsormidium nitens]